MQTVKKVFVAVVILFTSLTNYAQVHDNADRAFSIAKELQRPVLLIFSGTDWCQPCIRFKKTILSDSSFVQFASKNLVILEADFPQRKKLDAKTVARNEQLAERYNPNGIFPYILLLKPDLSVLKVVAYDNQTSRNFVQEISSGLSAVNMLKEYTLKTKLMGSAFEFIVVANDNNKGYELLTACTEEVQRIEKLLTEFSTDSETALINRNAGIQPVPVSEESYQLIKRSVHISQLTNGTFDITAGALKKLYNFKGQQFQLPGKEVIQETLSKIGYHKIQLQKNNRVLLQEKNMHIGFGAIGKGYAADKLKQLLQQKGVESAVINASGDLTAWGLRADGSPWKTGIAHPADASKIIAWLPVNGISVATSGNYIQYFDVNGKRYSHNINPLTGYPVTGIKSVTIISPGAELSDALATAVTVMGVKAGIHFVNQLPQTHCILVDDADKVYYSKNIQPEHAG